MGWWQYLLLVNLYLILFYGFYALLLRKETFFQLNRIYLVSTAILSFFIPVIHSDWVQNLFITQRVEQTLSVYAAPITVYHFRPIEDHHLTIGQVMLFIYAAGAVILILKFIWQLLSLKKIIDKPESSGAFSFFKSIKLGATSDGLDIIEAHEQVHANQWHSLDVLLIEAITIINWFNPIVYFYRFGIKYIHEFIADRQALENGTDKAEYAMLLLSQTLQAPAHQLVNPFFNQSLLKLRIIMMQKSRSQRMALLKYGLSAPLFILMLVLSSATISRSTTVKLFNKRAEIVLLKPASTLNPVNIHIAAPEVIIEKPAVEKSSKVKVPDAIDLADGDPIFMTVEKEPEFVGGISEFYKFLGENLKYPEIMLRNNIQGKVFIGLTVEKDGSLTDIKSMRDIGYGSAEEAIRVLKLSPKWNPGYQNGRRVRVRYNLPITFAIEKEKAARDSLPKIDDDEIKIARTPAPDTVKKYNTTLIGLDGFNNPFYILDGKAVPDLNNVNPDRIESISVYRQKKDLQFYVAQYGPKALNGVVVIKTKSTPKSQPIR